MSELDNDLALTLIRVVAGLVIAAHGAQKVFGVFGGPGLVKWHGAVRSMGFAQPRVIGTLAAFAELFGGLALALGLYTPIVAALVAVDLIVAIVKAHWTKGFFVQKGGYEYVLVLLAVTCAVGLTAPTRYSVDAALGLFAGTALWFVVVLVASALVTLGAALAGANDAPVPVAERTAQR